MEDIQACAGGVDSQDAKVDFLDAFGHAVQYLLLHRPSACHDGLHRGLCYRKIDID